MQRWTDDERELLKALYSTTPNRDIAERLNRSTKAVSDEAKRQQLKKSRAYLAEMGRKNVEHRIRTIGVLTET